MVGEATARAQEHEASPGVAAPGRERGEVGVPAPGGSGSIVESALANAPVVEREAGRLDHLELHAEAGGQTQCRPEIVRPVGLEERQ